MATRKTKTASTAKTATATPAATSESTVHESNVNTPVAEDTRTAAEAEKDLQERKAAAKAKADKEKAEQKAKEHAEAQARIDKMKAEIVGYSDSTIEALKEQASAEKIANEKKGAVAAILLSFVKNMYQTAYDAKKAEWKEAQKGPKAQLEEMAESLNQSTAQIRQAFGVLTCLNNDSESNATLRAEALQVVKEATSLGYIIKERTRLKKEREAKEKAQMDDLQERANKAAGIDSDSDSTADDIAPDVKIEALLAEAMTLAQNASNPVAAQAIGEAMRKVKASFSTASEDADASTSDQSEDMFADDTPAEAEQAVTV